MWARTYLPRPFVGRSILAMYGFSRGFRAFVEGFDWRLIRDYWKAVREHAWEIFWGSGVPGIIFTVYTLYYAPARVYLPWAVAWAILVAGYFIWRADHVRLVPKLGIGDITMKYSGVGREHPDKKRRYVQVLVKCETEGPIKDCRGQLLNISKWAEGAGEWYATHINETLDLEWSFVNDPQTVISLEHGAPRQLNVFWVENTHRDVVICTRFHPRLKVAPLDRFKFDVRVAGEECPPVYASFEVTIGNAWCDLTCDDVRRHAM